MEPCIAALPWSPSSKVLWLAHCPFFSFWYWTRGASSKSPCASRLIPAILSWNKHGNIRLFMGMCCDLDMLPSLYVFSEMLLTSVWGGELLIWKSEKYTQCSQRNQSNTRGRTHRARSPKTQIPSWAANRSLCVALFNGGLGSRGLFVLMTMRMEWWGWWGCWERWWGF